MLLNNDDNEEEKIVVSDRFKVGRHWAVGDRRTFH
jgi:hypothetical protein